MIGAKCPKSQNELNGCAWNKKPGYSAGRES